MDTPALLQALRRKLLARRQWVPWGNSTFVPLKLAPQKLPAEEPPPASAAPGKASDCGPESQEPGARCSPGAVGSLRKAHHSAAALDAHPHWVAHKACAAGGRFLGCVWLRSPNPTPTGGGCPHPTPPMHTARWCNRLQVQLPPGIEPLVLWEPPPGEAGEAVVVDDMLTQWLRPHQREGVQFMFDCVCGLRQFEGQGGWASGVTALRTQGKQHSTAQGHDAQLCSWDSWGAQHRSPADAVYRA